MNRGVRHCVFQYTSSPSNQVGILNPLTKTWTLRATTGNTPSKRHDASLASDTNGTYLFGGDTSGDLYYLQGTAEDADSAPHSTQGCNPLYFSILHLHGLFMFIGWGLLLQLGAFIARYFRHKGAMWFNLHKLFQVGTCMNIVLIHNHCPIEEMLVRRNMLQRNSHGVFFQVVGVFFAIGGFVCGVYGTFFSHFESFHGVIGLVVMIIGILQPLNGFL